VQISCVASSGALLGEGPLWDAARGVIWWVDIDSAALHAHHVASGVNRVQSLQCRLTALALCEDDSLLACGDRGFVRLHVSAGLRVRIDEVLAAPAERAGNRFNDGKVDSAGRFWAGTMDGQGSGPHGSLYRLDAQRGATAVRSNLWVPNGPCFLADGTMLAADTYQGRITAVTLDAAGDSVAEREFARFGGAQGYPDGMTVDAHDHVWVAFWDGWCLRRLSPAGEVVAEIALPVQRPTCPTFGGPALESLYVTTARTGLSPEALSRQPHAGGLLRLDPGVQGLAPARFRG